MMMEEVHSLLLIKWSGEIKLWKQGLKKGSVRDGRWGCVREVLIESIDIGSMDNQYRQIVD